MPLPAGARLGPCEIAAALVPASAASRVETMVALRIDG
jgi:hypothetical protein